MKLAPLLLALTALAACSRKTPAPAPAASASAAPSTTPAMRRELSAELASPPTGLTVEGDTISYCVDGKSRALDPRTGTDVPFARACAAKDGEGNTACGGLALDVTVRSPGLGPHDHVDIGAASYPLEGHVQDCVADGKVLAIATRSSVVLIDSAKETTDVLDANGAERVAIGERWVAWVDGRSVRARRR